MSYLQHGSPTNGPHATLYYATNSHISELYLLQNLQNKAVMYTIFYSQITVPEPANNNWCGPLTYKNVGRPGLSA